MLIKITHRGHIVNEWHNVFVSGYLEGIEAGAKKINGGANVSF